MSEVSYTVYEPAAPRKNLVARADELVFVRDGFSGWAMIASVLWMIYHGLWQAVIGFFVVLLVLTGAAHLAGAPEGAGGVLFVGLSIAFGFVANDVRRIVLEQSGHRLIGTIAGASRLECERRFFHNWSPLREIMPNEERL